MSRENFAIDVETSEGATLTVFVSNISYFDNASKTMALIDGTRHVLKDGSWENLLREAKSYSVVHKLGGQQ